MHVVIVGCGRSGAALAARLDSEGEAVHVIDVDGATRARLPVSFRGGFVAGDAMRRAVLEEAHIAQADGVTVGHHPVGGEGVAFGCLRLEERDCRYQEHQ